MSGPSATAVHRIEGRTRLRIRSHRGDEAYFEHVGEELARCPGVETVRVSPRTGSVLLEHEAALDAIGRYAASHDLFEIEIPEEPHLPPLARVYEEVLWIDRRMRARTADNVDLETLAFYALVGAGIYKIVRGDALPAGMTLLVQAAQLAAEVGAARARH